MLHTCINFRLPSFLPCDVVVGKYLKILAYLAQLKNLLLISRKKNSKLLNIKSYLKVTSFLSLSENALQMVRYLKGWFTNLELYHAKGIVFTQTFDIEANI